MNRKMSLLLFALLPVVGADSIGSDIGGGLDKILSVCLIVIAVIVILVILFVLLWLFGQGGRRG